LCLFWARSIFVLLPLVIAFHLGTWATMDTGPYMTLWYLWIVFVPIDRIPAFVRAVAPRWWLLLPFGVFALAMVAIVAWVIQSVVPAWAIAVAAAITVVAVVLGRAEH
jgi:hypothetical protein